MLKRLDGLWGPVQSLCEKTVPPFENGAVDVVIGVSEESVAALFRAVLDLSGFGVASHPFSLHDPIWLDVVKSNLDVLSDLRVGFEVCANNDWYTSFRTSAKQLGVAVDVLETTSNLPLAVLFISCEDVCRLYPVIRNKAISDASYVSMRNAMESLVIVPLYEIKDKQPSSVNWEELAQKLPAATRSLYKTDEECVRANAEAFKMMGISIESGEVELRVDIL